MPTDKEGEVFVASATAPVNLAVVKYWGKRDPKLNLPTNSSLSVTLSQKHLRAQTTASCSSRFSSTRLFVNGSEETITPNSRLAACIAELRRLRQNLEDSNNSLPYLSGLHLLIVSENNFPTAAGLASSAAGFAALVRATADLYKLPFSPQVLSRIARQGSGSACRSMMGGFVAWDMGNLDDGSDSQAVQVEPLSHWSEIRAIIIVVSAVKKAVSSSQGMQNTVQTSELFAERLRSCVPTRMRDMRQAIHDRDFDSFARLTMRDSNQFHAVCMDTEPPIFYLNDTSRQVIQAVNEINRTAGHSISAYTFDAGPNAVIFYEAKNERQVLSPFRAALKSANGWTRQDSIDETFMKEYNRTILEGLDVNVQQVILTEVGEGPKSIKESFVDKLGNPNLQDAT